MTSSLYVEICAAKYGVPYSPAGLFAAVDGTVYPGAPAPPYPIRDDGNGYWCGFSSGIAGGLMNVADGLWASSLCGYPAVVTPMWPSVQIGRTNLAYAIKMYADWYFKDHGTYEGLVLTMSGYSQGAMVTNQVYVLDFLAPDGALHYLLPYLYRMYNFGDIFRTPGVAHLNALAGLPESIMTDGVETGGIGGKLDLTPDQSNMLAPDGNYIVMSAANYGDIYTCCPVGTNPWTKIASAGNIGNTFFKIVMQPTFIDVISVAKVILHLGGSFEEMINGLRFAAEGTNAPHWHYFPQMNAAITDMLKLGNSLPHQGVLNGGNAMFSGV